MEYYRITAYHSDEDISVILDSYGKFETLWDFSATLVSHGFKIITLSRAEAIAESTFPFIEQSNKIAVRAIGKGLPELQDMIYENRRCKVITVYDKIYGQYMD